MPRGFETVLLIASGGGSIPSVVKGKGGEVSAVPRPSPGAAAAQHRLSDDIGPLQGNMFGGGLGGNDMLGGLRCYGRQSPYGGPSMGPGMGGLSRNCIMTGLLGWMGCGRDRDDPGTGPER